MIKIFGKTDTTFTSNGDIVVSPLKAKIHKQDNGEYCLNLETGLEYVDYMVEGNIVVANTPTGDQAFRIGNVTKTKSKIVSKCYHVFYDSENYLIASAEITNKTCSEALVILNASVEPQTEFATISDVTGNNSYTCIRKSLYEAIKDIIGIYGGHLVRDNFTIAVRSSIGQDNGIIVQYKKNLKDITCQENWNNVVTKLLPVGKDGILLNAVDPLASIYVTSATQYDLPYCKTVTFAQDGINQEDYPTEQAYKTALVADLLSQAQSYVNTNCLPQINYTLKANLEKVTDIGDTIEVIDERLGVNMMTNVIGFEYDCILEQYTEVEFGNFTQSISGLVSNVTSTAEKIATETAQNATDQIIGIMNNSFVIYDGTRILVVDSLPKESANDVIIIDYTGIGFSQSGISGNQTSKWSIDGTMTLGEHTVSDIIKAQGTTNGWQWQKWSSGKVIAWKQVTITPTWSAFGAYYKGSADVTYPFNIANAVISATLEDCPDVGWIANVDAVDNTKTNISVVREGNTGSVSISLVLLGTEPS